MNRRTPTPKNRRLAPPSVASFVEESARIAKTAKEPWDPTALWRHLAFLARVAVAVGIVSAGFCAAIAARRYVTTSPRFALHDLRVTGAHHRDVESLTQLAGVHIGDNVVELDLDAMRARLEADPWVERASVLRRLPSTLTIEVVERDAAAIVAMPAGAVLSTASGEVFKKLEDGDPADLPVVTGIQGEDIVRDRDAVSQLVRRALDLDAEIERAAIFGGRVEELHFDADGGVSAVIGRRGVRVAFGQGPYRAKIRLAARVEGELARRGARPTALFLDDDQHPERIVVRLVAGLPPAQVTIDGVDSPSQGKKKLVANAGKGAGQ